MGFPVIVSAPSPATVALVAQDYDNGTGIPGQSSIYSTGGLFWGLIGAPGNSTRGYDPTTGRWGLTLDPPGGADQAVYANLTNGGNLFNPAISFLQGGTQAGSLFPSTPNYRVRFRVACGPTMVPNAGGVDSWVFFGVWDDFGLLFSRPRGEGIGLLLRGDAPATWRIYAQDGPLSSGGSVTLDTDTGIAPGTLQALELTYGIDNGDPFFRFLIDGAVAFEAAPPVATGLPSTNYEPTLGVIRGADAADSVAFYTPDQAYPSIVVELS